VLLDPREYLNGDFSQDAATQHLNARLRYDGFVVKLVNSMPRVMSLKTETVAFTPAPASGNPNDPEFVQEQLQKCDSKIEGGDYDGAITNARAFLEAYLLAIEQRYAPEAPDYDGDLPKLYKRVQARLNLDPARKDLIDMHRQTLTGLVSVIGGIAGFSNKMGDRHVRKYRPAERHARLVVNCAKTVADFLQATLAARADAGAPL
jgi:hypothetical protein